MCGDVLYSITFFFIKSTGGISHFFYHKFFLFYRVPNKLQDAFYNLKKFK